MHDSIPNIPCQIAMNPSVMPPSAYPESLLPFFQPDDIARAQATISQWPAYEVSPLRSLAGWARELGIASLHYKDEGQRFGLGSFKPLGGAYAVTRLLTRIIQERGGEQVDPGDLLQGRYAAHIADITVTAATDGNHGRSVAWGAKHCGCRCVVYIHEHVSRRREDAIAALGAEVVRLPGTYDDSVRKAFESARAPGWHIIQDTSDGEGRASTLDVMHGYTLLATETLAQLPEPDWPTHIFLQAGVGGMAAAVLAGFWQAMGEQRPVSILAEPDKAACCYLSIQAGEPRIAPGDLDSMMAGLACGEVSLLAWDVLKAGFQGAVALPDSAAGQCMRLLADGCCGDAPIVAGESAVAGLAALAALTQNACASQALGLNANSRVLVIGTEGDTDPELFQQIVGRSAEAVRAA